MAFTNQSWIESANRPDADFTLDNLPFGAFEHEGSHRCGVAIGDEILDLAAAAGKGLLAVLPDDLRVRCSAPDLGPLMKAGREAAETVRSAVRDLLRGGAPQREVPLIARRDAAMRLPCTIGDYTDFYASIHHATNVGSMFRPDNPLLPNYKWVPIGYHGRSSSIVVSGTPFRRPLGQTKEAGAKAPQFGPSRRLDYELEMGMFIARGNAMGERIAVEAAEDHVFGLCIVNDWSARDIQTWEYQPLGPFLAKNFATTISPWLVTLAALEPFRVPPQPRGESDPQPLPHLAFEGDRAFDLQLEVSIRTARMREPFRVSRGNFRDMYWTLSQLVAHHTSNGCNLQPGDLLASGTVSGASKESRGCLLERTWRGSEPIELPSGETRRFLEDGDEVIMRAWGEREGVRVGFGECRGTVESPSA